MENETWSKFQQLIGKKVKGVRLRPKPDENGRRTYEPIIYFDDGSYAAFYNDSNDWGGVKIGIRIAG